MLLCIHLNSDFRDNDQQETEQKSKTSTELKVHYHTHTTLSTRMTCWFSAEILTSSWKVSNDKKGEETKYLCISYFFQSPKS